MILMFVTRFILVFIVNKYMTKHYFMTFKLDFTVLINPYLTNGFSHHYQLDESTFIFRGVRSDFYFLSHFSMKLLLANSIAPDGTPLSAASHLGLYCLPLSHKKDARLI